MKRIRLLLFVALLLMVQNTWADEATLTLSTMTVQNAGFDGPAGTSTVDKNAYKNDAGWVVQCNTLDKTINGAYCGRISNQKYYYWFKNSNGRQMTVKLPDGCVATSVTFYAISNYDYSTQTKNPAILSECNGDIYSDSIADKGATPTVIVTTQYPI